MIQIIKNSIDKDAWKALASEAELSNYFQTIECFTFFSSLSFLEPFVYGVQEKNKLVGVIIGYIQKDGGKIKQYFSRRAVILGGPLLADDISDAALAQLLTYTKKQLASKAIFIESRNFNDYFKHKYVFVKSGFDYVEHLNFHIDTTTFDIFYSNVGKSRKRDVKTSIRDGASVEYSPTIEQVREYYMILDNLYKTKVKTPLYPFEYFENLYKLPEVLYCLIQLNNEIIGGTVCVTDKKGVVYELFACGKDGVFKNIYPSTLATYSAIEYSAKNNFSRFDMMGAGKPDEGYGVRDFKSKFGGELVQHGRFLCVLNPMLYSIGKFGVKFLKRK